jgi:DNA-directed RNA polymerase subunit E'/Rpb7
MEQNKTFKRGMERSVYELSLLTRRISLQMNVIGENLPEIINTTMINNFEGKCVVEGYIKPNSINIISYSSGLISGDMISFEVVFQCSICYPVEGMTINCVAKNITKAGIRGESSDETPSPFVVFIARDHHYMNEYFSNIKENDAFKARVIGQRFELNDKYISIIAELKKPKKIYDQTK